MAATRELAWLALTEQVTVLAQVGKRGVAGVEEEPLLEAD